MEGYGCLCERAGGMMKTTSEYTVVSVKMNTRRRGSWDSREGDVAGAREGRILDIYHPIGH